MKTFLIGLSLATLAAGTAFAVESQRANPDADGNGILTRAEAEARASGLFARVDANKDGKIDTADREARRAARFDRMDSDKSGQISRAEFAAGQPRRGIGDREAGVHDGDRKGGHRRRGHGGGMMRGPLGGLADANKDGAISQAEFTAASLQRFDRADANKDGQVTREERRTARDQMRREWGGHAPQPSPPPAN